ncbi:MAG: biotin/lipoyl-containing protein [Spirochaetota bacterium]
MDKEFLYELMAEFEKRNIQELAFENETVSIHLLKSGGEVPQTVVAAPTLETPANTPENGEGGGEGELIRAPIVGNFYRQPAPDAPHFVTEGESVKKGQTLCILEAMKTMNELVAEFDCEIIKVLLESGTMVQYDTPLFEVKRL